MTFKSQPLTPHYRQLLLLGFMVADDHHKTFKNTIDLMVIDTIWWWFLKYSLVQLL